MAHDEDSPDTSPGIRRLLTLSIPALGIGIGSAVTLKLLDALADWLQDVLWETLPAQFGADRATSWWIFLVLTLIGVAVGAVVWLMPGHGGPDSATTELSGPFPTLGAVPSVAIVVVLGLAGGVSLGPENPIIGINVALAVAVLARTMTSVPKPLVVMLTMAGTIGALFGTPVAAALLFTGTVGALKGGGSLWDKLFLPLAAGGAGSLTTLLLGGHGIAFHLPGVEKIGAIDLLWGVLIAAVAAALAVVGAWLLPLLYRVFHTVRHPLLMTTLGGVTLGLLGVLGGPMTLFKGLNETGELLTHPSDYTAGQLTAFAGIKLLALLVAAASGFRGGRIFPIVFVGAALGLLAPALVPSIPLSLGVACAVLGVTLVGTRDGWVALFLAVALTGDYALLPVLCLVLLPTWLLVTQAPALVVTLRATPETHATA
ncbi:ion channel protein [Miniimonas sp. S16]|uniref:ion channel protein n=1 Tax=Miniimonas sp. S16 TaxID=2171623 RepID=UPI000D529CCA|nr:ion channel protein [Miniimonas sp. S16]